MPDVVAIIQARMGSTRLPGKVLMPMAGVPMLERVIRRVKEAKQVGRIIVAMPYDDFSCRLGYSLAEYSVGMSWPQVAEEDVLSRFVKAIDDTTEIVVRVCGDSPLIRPDLIDDCVQRLRDSLYHYVSYMLPSGEVAIETKRGVYPEAFTARALRYADHHSRPLPMNRSLGNREHVTPMMRRQREYNPWLVQVAEDDGLNCAVDTQEDFDRVEKLIMEQEAVPA